MPEAGRVNRQGSPMVSPIISRRDYDALMTAGAYCLRISVLGQARAQAKIVEEDASGFREESVILACWFMGFFAVQAVLRLFLQCG